MTRVALISNTAFNIANFRGGVIRALREQGVEVLAIAPPDDYSATLESMGCLFIPWQLEGRGINPLRELLALWRLVQILHRERPALTFHYTIKAVIYGGIAARISRIPHIAMLTGLGYVFITESLVSKIARLLYRRVLKWPLQVWFQNSDDRSEFIHRRLAEASQCVVLPGSGVNLSFFTPVSKPHAEHGCIFLLIARLLWDKGVGEYVEAARRLKACYPQARFQLLGAAGVSNPSAIEIGQVDQWVREGWIEYLGTTRDVRPYIAAADCIVLPSYREGVPRTLLEATAMARPIVATDVAGCREAVVDGINGFLCRVKDPADLAEKMERIITMSPVERALLGQAGRSYVEERFDERIVVGYYTNVLQRLGMI